MNDWVARWPDRLVNIVRARFAASGSFETGSVFAPGFRA